MFLIIILLKLSFKHGDEKNNFIQKLYKILHIFKDHSL